MLPVALKCYGGEAMASVTPAWAVDSSVQARQEKASIGARLCYGAAKGIETLIACEYEAKQ